MDTLSYAFIVLSCLWSLPTAQSQAIDDTSLATTVYPMMNQYLPLNSATTVTYNCSVGSNYSIVWSVGGTQISNDNQITNFMNLGYTIEPMNFNSSSSMITVSVTGRRSTIECLPFVDSARACTDCTVEYAVVPFASPSAPTNVRLSLLPSLTLDWTRPSVPPFTQLQVPISYTVEINATEENGMNFRNFTSDPTLSVQYLEDMLRDSERECVEFEFYVTATNDAGTGPLARIKDTVPISPDVRNIDQELIVTSVDVLSQTAQISFPPVQPCSVNFSLTNYTININGAVHRTLDPEDVMSGVPLSITNLVQDVSSTLTVTACNSVTCRTSNQRTLNTTDVQTVQAVFFENRLFLQCSFATNSQARGCIFNFTLISANPIPPYNVSREEGSGSMCVEAPYRRDAYGDVFVMDWEEGGEEGGVALDVTDIIVSVSTPNEYTELTGCPAEAVLPNTGGQRGLSGGGIGGIVVAVLLVFIGLVVAVIISVVVAIKRYFSPYKEIGEIELQNNRGTMAAGPPPPPGPDKNLQFTKQEGTHSETLIYECEVETGEELLINFESLLEPKPSASGPTSSVAKSTAGSEENEAPKTARLEYHDADTPLTLKIHWKPLFESLLASSQSGLRDQKKFNFAKLKVQLEF